MVATDAKSGKSNKPTTVQVDTAKDGTRTVTFPGSPQINAPDREQDRKPAATLTGYARGGTTNPSEGDDGEVAYFDENMKETSADAVLTADVDESASENKKGK